MARLHNPPSAERILTILAELYADQMGVKVEVKVVDNNECQPARV